MTATPNCPPWCVKTTHTGDPVAISHRSRSFMSGDVTVFVSAAPPVIPVPTLYVYASTEGTQILLFQDRSKAEGLAAVLDAVGAREAGAAVREAAALLPEEADR